MRTSRKTSPWITAHRRTIAFVIAGCIAFAFLGAKIDPAAVHDAASRVNGVLAFALLTLLPLFGFPVTPLHLAAGLRFGSTRGMLLVSLSILLQLLASYAIVHRWRAKLRRWLAPVRKQIPDGENATICIFTLLLPGVPFFAKNYVLPLLGVPLRTYLLCCLPIHTLRSGVAVILGGNSDELTATRVTWLAVYWTTLLLVSWWCLRRLRSQVAPARTARA